MTKLFKPVRNLLILGLSWGAASAQIVWSPSSHDANSITKTTRGTEWYKFASNSQQDYFQPNNVFESMNKIQRLALGIRLVNSGNYGGMGFLWNSNNSTLALSSGVCVTYRSPQPVTVQFTNSADAVANAQTLTASLDYKVANLTLPSGAYKGIQFLYSGAGAGASNTLDIVQVGLGTVCSSTPSTAGTSADVPTVGVSTTSSTAFWDLSSAALTTVPAATALGGTWETFAGANATVAAKSPSSKTIGFTATLSPSGTSDYPVAGISMDWLAGKDTADFSTQTGLCVTYRASKPLRLALEQAGIIYDNNGGFYNGNFFAKALPAQTSFKAVNLLFSDFTQETSWGFKTVQDLKRQLALRFEYKSNTASTNDVEILQVGFTGQCQDVDFPLTQLRSSLDTTFTEDDTLKVALSSFVLDRDSELKYTLESNSGTSLKSVTFRNDTLIAVSVLNPAGTNTLQITATDVKDPNIFASFTLTATPTNTPHAPVALNDVYNVNEDSKLVVNGPEGVLTNDYDQDNETLTLAIKNAPSHASSFTLLADGGFEYTPSANYFGTDEFTYTITDGNTTVSGKATLTIVNVNDKPTVQGSLNNLADLVEDFTTSVLVTVHKSDLGNGSNWATFADLDADNLSYMVHTNGKIRSSVVSNNTVANTFTFSLLATKDSNGLAIITLYAKDAKDSVGIAFSVNITPTDDKPTAIADSYSTTEDLPLIVTDAKGLFVNDLNPDKLPLSATIVDPLSHGTLTLGTNGDFTYTPDKNWNGKDTLTYTLTVGSAVSDTAATVVFTVAAVNDSPELAVNASIADTTVLEDFNTAVQIPTAGLFTDPEGNALTLSVASSNKLVKAVLGNTGILVLTSVRDSNGTATITLSATDGKTGTIPATLSFLVKITPVNDAPIIAQAQENLTQEAGVWTLKVPLGKLFRDPDGDVLAWEAQDQANLTFTLNDDTLSIQSDSAPAATYNLSIIASDPAGATKSMPFKLVVTEATAIHVVPLAPAQNWQQAVQQGQGRITLHDLQGRNVWNHALPVSPDLVHKAASPQNGPVILQYGDQNWLLAPAQP